MGITNDDEMICFKRPQDAVSILTDMEEDGDISIEPMRTFGTHVRAQTQGDYKDNWNNHPVYFNNVWVVHNGGISNDDEIRKTVKVNQDAIPVVDSVAINIVLSQMKDPHNLDELIESIDRLDGSFAFHAIWQEHPGLSLIVRGTSSPLITAWHESSCFVYGSTIESVYGIIEAMNLDPNTDEWTYRSMDQNQLILLQDGLPIIWGTLPTISWQNKSKTDFFMQRILPKEDERKELVVYQTDSIHDFAQKGDDYSLRNWQKANANNLEVIYTREKGIVKLKGKPRESFPRGNDINLHSVTSEAKQIIRNNKDNVYHVFFGDIEIIMNMNRVVLDVYDRGFVEETEDRWRKVEKEEEKVSSDSSDQYSELNNFYIAKSTSIKVPTVNERFDYLKVSNPYTIPTYPLAIGVQRSMQVTSDNAKYWSPILEFDWKAIFEPGTIANHIEYRDLWFLQNDEMWCNEHKKLVTKHDDPYNCKDILLAAAYTYSCINDLDVIKYLLDDIHILYEHNNKSDHDCDKKHDWWPTGYRRVYVDNVCFDILVEEMCSNCSDKKKAFNFPKWLDQMMDKQTYEVYTDAH